MSCISDSAVDSLVILMNLLIILMKPIKGTPWDETFSMLSILKI